MKPNTRYDGFSMEVIDRRKCLADNQVAIRKLLSGAATMITRAEILMGRDVKYPLTVDLESNLDGLIKALNLFRQEYGIPMLVSSGYRPGPFNALAGGAENSPHLTCEACDFHDPDGAIKNWVLQKPLILVECKLYMENPMNTRTWIHLQTRPVPSGRRIFSP